MNDCETMNLKGLFLGGYKGTPFNILSHYKSFKKVNELNKNFVNTSFFHGLTVKHYWIKFQLLILKSQVGNPLATDSLLNIILISNLSKRFLKWIIK